MIVAFESCFDGERFRGRGWVAADEGTIHDVVFDDRPRNADHRVGFLMPSLVDMAGGVFGYVERFPDSGALEPLQACLDDYRAAGVEAVVDSVQPLATVRSLHRLRQGRGPDILAAGGALDAAPVARPSARVVCRADDVHHEISSARRDGADLVAVGRYLPAALLPAVTAKAGTHGLPLVVGWGSSPRAAVPGAVMSGVGVLPFGLGDWTALPGLAATVCGRDGQAQLRRWLRDAAEAGTVVIPTVSLLTRRLVLQEVVSDPGWASCERFLPYVTNFARMGGPVGLAVGRRKLAERVWVGTGRSGEADTALAMGDVIGGLLAEFVTDGGVLGLGSGFPEFGVFPRSGLRAEAHLLTRSGLSWEAVLAAATSVPGRTLFRGERGVICPGAAWRAVVSPTVMSRAGWPSPLMPAPPASPVDDDRRRRRGDPADPGP